MGCGIKGIETTIEKNGKTEKVNHEYMMHKISNFDQTSTVLSSKIKEKHSSKVYISRLGGKRKGNIKKSSTSKIEWFRTKTHISTSGDGSLDFAAIIVKGKLKE